MLINKLINMIEKMIDVGCTPKYCYCSPNIFTIILEETNTTNRLEINHQDRIILNLPGGSIICVGDETIEEDMVYLTQEELEI